MARHLCTTMTKKILLICLLIVLSCPASHAIEPLTGLKRVQIKLITGSTDPGITVDEDQIRKTMAARFEACGIDVQPCQNTFCLYAAIVPMPGTKACGIAISGCMFQPGSLERLGTKQLILDSWHEDLIYLDATSHASQGLIIVLNKLMDGFAGVYDSANSGDPEVPDVTGKASNLRLPNLSPIGVRPAVYHYSLNGLKSLQLTINGSTIDKALNIDLDTVEHSIQEQLQNSGIAIGPGSNHLNLSITVFKIEGTNNTLDLVDAMVTEPGTLIRLGDNPVRLRSWDVCAFTVGTVFNPQNALTEAINQVLDDFTMDYHTDNPTSDDTHDSPEATPTP